MNYCCCVCNTKFKPPKGSYGMRMHEFDCPSCSSTLVTAEVNNVMKLGYFRGMFLSRLKQLPIIVIAAVITTLSGVKLYKEFELIGVIILVFIILLGFTYFSSVKINKTFVKANKGIKGQKSNKGAP